MHLQYKVILLLFSATATTKKQAKQLVAQKMIDLLKTSVGDAFIAASESQKTDGKVGTTVIVMINVKGKPGKVK
jgi:hypothetical protein